MFSIAYGEFTTGKDHTVQSEMTMKQDPCKGQAAVEYFVLAVAVLLAAIWLWGNIPGVMRGWRTEMETTFIPGLGSAGSP